MDLNLTGKTVTQSMVLLRQAMAEATGELTVRTDNETVKLNLLNQIHKAGIRCKAERIGPTHVLKLKVSKGMPPPPGSGEPAFSTQPKEKIAFPAGEVSPSEVAEAERQIRKRRRARKKEARNQAAAPSPQPAPVAQAQAARGRWLIIQNDQMGQRDVNLGCELLEDLLEQLDPKIYTGVFLVHRGVRLLDPGYREGKPLRILTRKNLKLMACKKSLNYYQLVEKTKVAAVSFGEILSLATHNELIWV